jgi:hypothetical protein
MDALPVFIPPETLKCKGRIAAAFLYLARQTRPDFPAGDPYANITWLNWRTGHFPKRGAMFCKKIHTFWHGIFPAVGNACRKPGSDWENEASTFDDAPDCGLSGSLVLEA